MIRFGIIGCGRISEKHVVSIAKCSNARLTGLYDPLPERMEELERKYSLVNRELSTDTVAVAKHSDPDGLLRDANVDAVVIATPSHSHAHLAVAALRAGKPVLLEKPMALSLRDADEIAESAANLRLRVQVCHQLRYRPLMRLAKEWVDNGTLGTIRSGTVTVRLNRSPAYYAAAPWRGSWDQDGGMLLNQGVHLIDLLLWMMGETVDSVYGMLGWGKNVKPTEDVAIGTIRFANGAIGIVEANTISQPNNLDQSLSLFGDLGTISIGGTGLTEVRRWHAVGQETPLLPEAADFDEHLAMYEHFVGSLQGHPHDPLFAVDTPDGRRALETVFAIYESARIASPIRLPLLSFDTRMMADHHFNDNN